MTDLFLHQVGSQHKATVAHDGMQGRAEVRRFQAQLPAGRNQEPSERPRSVILWQNHVSNKRLPVPQYSRKKHRRGWHVGKHRFVDRKGYVGKLAWADVCKDAGGACRCLEFVWMQRGYGS